MTVSGLALALEEFSRQNGLEPLRPDDQGRIRIVADDVEIVCFERFGRMHLISTIGPVPTPDSTAREWLKRLLRHGLKRMKHSRSTPALTDAGDAVLYASCAVSQISVHDLEARIEEHVNACEGYRAMFQSMRASRGANVAGLSILRP